MSRPCAAVLAALLLAGIAAATAPALAQEPRRPAAATARFWREVHEPGLRRAEALLRQARAKIAEVEPRHPSIRVDPVVRRAALQGAVERLRRAHPLSPRDPEITYWLGRTHADLADRRPDHPPTDREAVLEALHWLRRTQEIDPEFQADQVHFELAIAHARLHEWALAAEAYERSAELLLETAGAPTVFANLAEMRMLAGDLTGAVRDYQRSLDLSRTAGGPTDLAHWGLGVALDRLGEHDAALDHVWIAMGQQGGSMDALTQPGVFFEPPHEIHYYQALGFLAQARAGEAEAREQHLLSAVSALMEFLQNGGADGPFGASARHRLDLTRVALAPREPARRARPR